MLSISFYPVGLAQPHVIVGVLGGERHRFLALGNGVIKVTGFIVAAAEPVISVGILGIFCDPVS